jgi:hypothetical protein
MRAFILAKLRFPIKAITSQNCVYDNIIWRVDKNRIKFSRFIAALANQRKTCLAMQNSSPGSVIS